MNIKCVIFDLDGTLADSLWVWRQIDIDYLNTFNLKPDKKLYDDIAHLSFEQCAHYFKNRFNIKDSIETIMKTWNDMSISHYKTDIKLKPGAYEFLKSLKTSGIKIALATSNSPDLFEPCLKNNNVYDFFDNFTTSDEVKCSKNSPDVYLKAAEKNNCLPEECVVFEDILTAVKSAKSAGMKVVAVYDSHSYDTEKSLAEASDKLIHSYENLTVENFLNF